MNINEHERLSNLTLKKEQRFYCCSTFYSHSRIFYTAQNACPNIGVKPPLACSWVVRLTSVDKCCIWIHLSFWWDLVYKF